MPSPSISPEARRLADEFLRKGIDPPYPGFWKLTSGGIIYVSLPPGVRSPRALGLKRVWSRGPRLYHPATGEPLLKRARLWVDPEVTDILIDEWLKPYKPRAPLRLFETYPELYRQDRRIREVITYRIDPNLPVDLVVSEMNKLPYVGLWRKVTIRELGRPAIMVERGARPSIILDPSTGKFYGILDEDFPLPQVRQTAAIMIRMLASNFPQYVSVTRRVDHNIPQDVLEFWAEEAMD